MRNLMLANTDGQTLQTEWSRRVDVIAQEIFTESMTGDPPCDFAFCLAGSGARLEASPFSDLDCFVLVANDSSSQVDYFKKTVRSMADLLLSADGNGGLRLCNIMTPLGDNGNPKAPALIKTPQNMAGLVELPPSQIEGHISGGLLEHRFLFGTRSLYNDYKTDLNTVHAKTCFSFSSRPMITRGKKQGLEVLRETVNNPKFKAPNKTDKSFHVKEQFYRPPQFLAKGLAWYYGIDAAATTDQLRLLVAGNHMSQSVANNFNAILKAMAKLRFKLHLDREGEKDFVYLDQGARDIELNQLKTKSRNAEETERYNRLQAGTHLTAQEVKELVDVIPNLAYIMRLGTEFVRQKSKLVGKRGNPFNA